MLQDGKVAGNFPLRHPKNRDKLADTELALREEKKDSKPGFIGKPFKYTKVFLHEDVLSVRFRGLTTRSFY